MKCWAILKDSFREAIDTKVFYVMVGLSCLLILVVASLSFRQSTAEEMMRSLVSALDREPYRGRRGGPFGTRVEKDHLQFSLRGVEAVRGPADSPESDYRVTVRLANFDPEEPGQGKKALATLRDRFGRFGDLRAVEVTEVRPAGPNNPLVTKDDERRRFFELTTRPTGYTLQYWPHEPSLFFGSVPLSGIQAPLGVQIYFIEDLLVNNMGALVALIVSVIITAFFIPNMLRKGTVDLLLVKPIHRWTLLTYKFIGGLTFIFLNTALAVGGVWLVLGLRSGVWAPGFLLTIGVITFFFAILYTVSALFGLLTRSPVVAIMLTLVVWFVCYLVGQGHFAFEFLAKVESQQQVPVEDRISEGWWVPVINTVHFILPRTSDLNVLTAQLLRSGLITQGQLDNQDVEFESLNWGESLTVSLVFMAALLGLACWRFSAKDY
jgi:ABC-type transport system involved in multi-copper enzyme maturation permease subunit